MARHESIEADLQKVADGLFAIEALSWVLDPHSATGNEESAKVGRVLRHLVEGPMNSLEAALTRLRARYEVVSG